MGGSIDFPSVNAVIVHAVMTPPWFESFAVQKSLRREISFSAAGGFAAAAGTSRPSTGSSRLRGPPIQGALIYGAIFLAFKGDAGIVMLGIDAFAQGVKCLGSDGQYGSSRCHANGFDVNHQ